jgi:hypothetical protein
MAKVSVDRKSVERVMGQLIKAVTESVEQGIKNGLFHLPMGDRTALWVAADLIQKSGKFPTYKFTFYHLGMGAGTDTCAVTFIEEIINEVINEDA